MDYARTIIGYHGCEAGTAERLLMGDPFQPSDNDYDWLGPGVYFWEYGLSRAHEWAHQHRAVPAVIGAVIELGKCFDLLDARNTDLLSQLAVPYVDGLRAAGLQPPRNLGKAPDFKGRFFDCGLMRWALAQLDEAGSRYQTVRSAFFEGEPVYRDADRQTLILRRSHIQIAVRDPSCLRGVFRPTRRRTEG